MSIQSTNFISNASVNPSDFTIRPSQEARQASAPVVDLPKIENKPVVSSVPEVLQEAVDQANKVFSQIQSDVQFVLDKDSKIVVVKLVEQNTGVVINQYPTDHALAISKALTQIQQQTAELHANFKSVNSGLQGLLFKQKS